ncbi:MAG: histidine kinase, partial [Pseudomonadota bacterium]
MMPPAKAPLAPSKRSAKTTVSVPFRTVLFSMVILWAAYFALITLRSYVAGFEAQFELALLRSVVTASGIALTIVLWFILRLFDGRALWVKTSAAIIFALPVALAIGQVNQVMFADMQVKQVERYAEKNNLSLRRDEAGNLLGDVPVGGGDNSGQSVAGSSGSESILIVPAQTSADRWRAVLDIALGRYFLLLAWASLYFALLAGYQASAAQRREEEFRSAAKAAELRSLRYQVNPHFLFNTLNSLSALVMTGKPQRAEEMIQSISRF